MLSKKAVLKNFAIHYIQKNICVGVPFEIKLQAFRPANLLKKRPQHRSFPVRIAKFLRASVLKNIYERLLLCRLYKARCTLSNLSFAHYSGEGSMRVGRTRWGGGGGKVNFHLLDFFPNPIHLLQPLQIYHFLTGCRSPPTYCALPQLVTILMGYTPYSLPLRRITENYDLF